jgi:hypothetical protein
VLAGVLFELSLRLWLVAIAAALGSVLVRLMGRVLLTRLLWILALPLSLALLPVLILFLVCHILSFGPNGQEQNKATSVPPIHEAHPVFFARYRATPQPYIAI